MFEDDAARVVVFVEAFQPYGVSFVSSRTVTRYVTQVRDDVSKISAFLCVSRADALPCTARLGLVDGSTQEISFDAATKPRKVKSVAASSDLRYQSWGSRVKKRLAGSTGGCSEPRSCASMRRATF